ncbi:MAG: transposase, partial [Acidimicrobiales bacterium]
TGCWNGPGRGRNGPGRWKARPALGICWAAPMDAARLVLTRQLLEDLVRVDEQRRQTKKQMADAVEASGTTVTEVYGVGPFVACAMLGHVGDVSRAAFAAYNGIAPVEVSSGEKKIYRLSRRGNRRLNHAIHMAAITQVRFANSPGRAYYDRKRAEGKTGKEAVRALKRRISDVIYARLIADARAAGTLVRGPGGQTGNGSSSSVTGSHPKTPALRNSHSRTRPNTTARRPTTTRKTTRKASLHKEVLDLLGSEWFGPTIRAVQMGRSVSGILRYRRALQAQPQGGGGTAPE